MKRFSEAGLADPRIRSLPRRRHSGPAARDAGDASFPIDRWVRANSGALTFLGITLGVFVSRKFLVLPLAAMAALASDGIRGALTRPGSR
jgi:hypothetical protein